jgi:hypothetical protein
MSATATLHFSCHRGSYELEPGVLDEGARVTFTNGHCHSLALAIHRLTGWAICGADYATDDFEGYEHVPNHVFIQRPDGEYLDVTGVFDPGEQWGWDVEEIDPERVEGNFEDCYLAERADDARPWAEAVIAAYCEGC